MSPAWPAGARAAAMRASRTLGSQLDPVEAVLAGGTALPTTACTLTVDDDTPDTGQTVTFTIDVTAASSWVLDFGDSTSTNGTTDDTATHVYTSAGTPTATLTATGSSVAVDTVSLTVTAVTTGDSVLLESDDYVLLESGDKILLEA